MRLRLCIVMLLFITDAVAGPAASAAEITWNSNVRNPGPGVSQASHILNPPNSEVHFAMDFNQLSESPGDTGFGDGGDMMINGIPFELEGSPRDGGDLGIPGKFSHDLVGGDTFPAAYNPCVEFGACNPFYESVHGTTDDPDLDNLLNSQSWRPNGTDRQGNPEAGLATFELQGLAVGQKYLIQLIISRAGNTQAYEPDDGQGNFDTGAVAVRDQIQNMLGVFVADSSTQTFLLRSLNGDTSAANQDPMLSGIVVSSIPEPSTVALASIFGVLGLAASRIRRCS